MTSALKRPSNRQLFMSVPVALAIHNLEEAVGVGKLATASPVTLVWHDLWGSGPHALWAFYLALVTITLAVFAAAALGNLADPRSRGARILLVVQLALLVNVFWHIAAVGVLRGYAPGIVTASLINAPLSWIILRRCWDELWISHRAMVAVGLIAFVLHTIPAAKLMGILAGGH